ncbi:hypothetical protein QCA50_019533 [Cerrena zonata]|uniref:Uncharacterized protein n=1 Tax=Cerrena zonata TaxID=2478898 RepID=A0AAW0FC57_9APHY
MSHARRFGAKVSGNKLKFNVPVSTVNEAINRTLNEEIPEDEATPIPEIDDPIGERGDVSFLYEYLPIRLVADELQKRQSYPAAFAKFKQAALVIVGPSFEIPLYSAEGGGFRSEKYVKMKMAQRIALMYCCNRAAECLINIGKDSEALDWLDEVTILFHNMVFCNHKAMFDWIDVNMNSTEFYYERMKALSLSSKIFVRLGNTAAGVQRRWTAHTNCANLPPDVDQDRMDRLLPNDEMTDLIQFSHPDPKT